MAASGEDATAGGAPGDGLLLEAVPNFSEGRDRATIDAIAAALVSAGATLADVHSDADHHRSVFTVFGTAGALSAGLVEAVGVAVERIDLRTHAGLHPRVGACDVLPVVPLTGLVEQGAGMRAAVQCARDVAQHVGAGYDLPAIPYGVLADLHASAGGAMAPFAGVLRRGGLAALGARLAAAEVVALAGPGQLHPTAGAVLVGARRVLVAFNVVLAGDADAAIARSIAAGVREAGGGMRGVRALGIPLSERRTQVSVNIERWREIGPADVLDAVVDAVAATPASVIGCELVGLCPRSAWTALDVVARRRGVPVVAAANPVLEAHAERATVTSG